VLIDEQTSIVRTDDVAAALLEVAPIPVAGLARARELVKALTPSISLDAADAALGRLRDLLAVGDEREPLVLWLRGRSRSHGATAIPAWPGVQLIEAGLQPSDGLATDPERLPFVDGAFDAVIARDVVHQAPDPARVAAEMHRVLTVRGLALVEAPFVRQVEGDELDYQHFSLLGLRQLLRGFDELDSGVGEGPGSAVARAWRHLWWSLGGSGGIAFALRTVADTSGAWLKHADRVLRTRPGALDAAASVYFLGRRAERALDTGAILAGYRGRARPLRPMAAERPATEVFSEWATSGADEGMQRNHGPAVALMLRTALAMLDPGRTVRALDIGCGNGWVVRRLQADPRVSSAMGVDGSASMIAKARSLDPLGDYVVADLRDWTPPTRMTLVHSMEVIYYLDDPVDLLRRIRTDWLEADGVAVLGLDHYLENAESLQWPHRLKVRMTTWPMERWRSAMAEAGFVDTQAFCRGASGDGAGTLVLLGRAPGPRSSAQRGR